MPTNRIPKSQNIEIYQCFSQRLKELIKKDGRKPALIVRDSDVNINTINGWIQGRRYIDIGLLVRVTDTLNTSVDYLLGRMR